MGNKLKLSELIDSLLDAQTVVGLAVDELLARKSYWKRTADGFFKHNNELLNDLESAEHAWKDASAQGANYAHQLSTKKQQLSSVSHTSSARLQHLEQQVTTQKREISRLHQRFESAQSQNAVLEQQLRHLVCLCDTLVSCVHVCWCGDDHGDIQLLSNSVSNLPLRVALM